MKPLLKIDRLSKFYRLGKNEVREALKNASFEIYPGEILGLLGVNGAGKTTLSSILATLHPPTSGDILWQDLSIYSQLLSYRKILGYCPQNASIEKSLSMEEKLVFTGRCYGLSKSEAIERSQVLMKQLGIESYGKSYSNELSGGYRQRFLIAQALVHKPEIVILDEPTVGLDPHIRRQLWEAILELKSQNITVLLTTHYLDEAEALSDRVCLLHNGTIRAIDTPKKLIKQLGKNTLEAVFLQFMENPDLLLDLL